jgi:anti-anti-sigma factor
MLGIPSVSSSNGEGHAHARGRGIRRAVDAAAVARSVHGAWRRPAPSRHDPFLATSLRHGLTSHDGVIVSGTSLSVAIRRHEHAVVVALAGVLDESAVGGLGRLLEDLIDGQGNLEVVIDGRGLRRADRTGTGILAAAAERARRHGGILMVVPSESVRDAIVDAGVAVLRNPPDAPASGARSASSAPEMRPRVQGCGGR